TIGDGDTIAVNAITLGQNAGTSGTLTMSGTSPNATSLTVGVGGTGTITLGEVAGSSGTLNLDSGTSSSFSLDAAEIRYVTHLRVLCVLCPLCQKRLRIVS